MDLNFLNPCPKSWSAFRSLNGRVGVKKVLGIWEVSKQLWGRMPASRAEGATMGRGEEGGRWSGREREGAGQDQFLAVQRTGLGLR